jgi:hypothetical protein
MDSKIQKYITLFSYLPTGLYPDLLLIYTPCCDTLDQTLQEYWAYSGTLEFASTG